MQTRLILSIVSENDSNFAVTLTPWCQQWWWHHTIHTGHKPNGLNGYQLTASSVSVNTNNYTVMPTLVMIPLHWSCSASNDCNIMPVVYKGNTQKLDKHLSIDSLFRFPSFKNIKKKTGPIVPLLIWDTSMSMPIYH